MNHSNGEIQKLLAEANSLLGQGRRPDAIRLYGRVLAARPEIADAWFNLGYALRLEGAYQGALQAYAQALVHGAAGPEQIHLNRAVILTDHLRDDAAAERELRLALTIAPHYAPAWLNLGNLYEERGRREQALDCYDRIRALPSQSAGASAYEALARIAQLRPPAGIDDPVLREIQQAVSGRADISGSLRANLYFALGRSFDTLGEFVRAFAAFESGKQAAHRDHPRYDPERAERRTQALLAAFAVPAPAAAAPALPAPQPLFICGMFRSGSTLLEQVLAAHPDVAAAGELELLPRLVARELAPFPASMSALDEARGAELARRYQARLLERLPQDATGKAYATDKRPDNYLLIGLIKRLFPHARIIHTMRNPLDNALSVFMQHLNPRGFDYAGSLAGIGHHYGQYRRLMAHWKALYPDDIHDFDYDAFVARPEATLRPLLDFLGLGWNDACLQFHRLDNTVKTASYWQVRRPLYGDASGRWRHYRSFLGPLFAALADAGVDTNLR